MNLFERVIVVIVFVLVWIGIPAYISWKYDTTPKLILKYIWCRFFSRVHLAKECIVLKEDRTKPIRWFFWIPFIGRILIHNRDMKMHPEIRRELIISLIENTVAYFVVGYIAGYLPMIPLQTSLTVMFVIFMILIPLEYKLTMWIPKLFMSDGDIEYVEYVCVFYHAFLFIIAGTLIGYLLKGG